LWLSEENNYVIGEQLGETDTVKDTETCRCQLGNCMERLEDTGLRERVFYYRPRNGR
jgi:hypothetical protein